MNTPKSTRRDFLSSSGGMLAAGAAAPYFWTSVSSRADSPDSEYGSSSSGNSMIVDFRGNIVAQHTDASEWFVMGTIDIEALRKARSQIFMNYIAQLRMEVYANVFQGKSFFPPNAFLEKNKQSQDETWAIQTATVERLRREGILEKPSSSM